MTCKHGTFKYGKCEICTMETVQQFAGMSNEDVLKTAQLEKFKPGLEAALTSEERDAEFAKQRAAAVAAYYELYKRGIDLCVARDAVDCIGGGWPNAIRDRQYVIDRAVSLVVASGGKIL